MKLQIFVFSLLSVCITGCDSPTTDDVHKKSDTEVVAALPNEHPSSYYRYASRLFEEGKKNEAVFWFYAGQLRYRFHLLVNRNLEPSGDPALFGSLNATVGETINAYAGGNVSEWVKSIDRALEWDANNANGFTSKEKFATEHKEIREGLKKMRDHIASEAESIREQRKKAGLQNRG